MIYRINLIIDMDVSLNKLFIYFNRSGSVEDQRAKNYSSNPRLQANIYNTRRRVVEEPKMFFN